MHSVPSRVSRAQQHPGSHYKVECGADARLVQKCLEEELPPGLEEKHVFLDSDDLNDLRLLVTRVVHS